LYVLENISVTDKNIKIKVYQMGGYSNLYLLPKIYLKASFDYLVPFIT